PLHSISPIRTECSSLPLPGNERLVWILRISGKTLKSRKSPSDSSRLRNVGPFAMRLPRIVMKPSFAVGRARKLTSRLAEKAFHILYTNLMSPSSHKIRLLCLPLDPTQLKHADGCSANYQLVPAISLP